MTDFMAMRLNQLRLFGIFYSVLNLFILVMSCVTIAVYPSNDHVFSCLNECAIAKTNWGAAIMFTSRFLQDIAIMALLYFFWFVPRKYMRSARKTQNDTVKLNRISAPLKGVGVSTGSSWSDNQSMT
jgi:hypothetical protein